MSTHQRNADACTLVVSPGTADVLRLETKKVLMFGHDYFEDFLDFGPDAQYALATRYRDAITSSARSAGIPMPRPPTRRRSRSGSPTT
jgi:hypothetical protein